MSRWVRGLLLAGIGLALWPSHSAGQRLVSTAATAASDIPLITEHRLVRDSLQRIASGSQLFRSALDQLRRTARRVVVLTPDQVVVARDGSRSLRRFDPDVLAEVAPVARHGSRVDLVMVVVNLPLLESRHQQRGSLPWELTDDLDRILVHEVYGHALPYLLVGDLSGHCADPKSGERAIDACAIRRENDVRAELGLGRRTDAGLAGLALTRPASR